MDCVPGKGMQLGGQSPQGENQDLCLQPVFPSPSLACDFRSGHVTLSGRPTMVLQGPTSYSSAAHPGHRRELVTKPETVSTLIMLKSFWGYASAWRTWMTYPLGCSTSSLSKAHLLYAGPWWCGHILMPTLMVDPLPPKSSTRRGRWIHMDKPSQETFGGKQESNLGGYSISFHPGNYAPRYHADDRFCRSHCREGIITHRLCGLLPQHSIQNTLVGPYLLFLLGEEPV